MVFESKLKGKHWSCCSYQTSPHAVPYLGIVDTQDTIFQMPISHWMFRWGTGITETGKMCLLWRYSSICGGRQFLEEFSNSLLTFLFSFPSVIFRLLGSPLPFCQGQGGIFRVRALLYINALLGLKPHWNAWTWTAGTLVSDPCSSQGFADGRVWLGHGGAKVCQT